MVPLLPFSYQNWEPMKLNFLLLKTWILNLLFMFLEYSLFLREIWNELISTAFGIFRSLMDDYF